MAANIRFVFAFEVAANSV